MRGHRRPARSPAPVRFDWDPLSTLDADLAASYQRIGHKLRKQSQVEVRPIDALLAESTLSPPLSLLSVDIEGREVSALRSIDLDKWRPAIICLEVLTADGARDEGAVSHLTAHGYEICSDLGLDILFKRTDSHVNAALRTESDTGQCLRCDGPRAGACVAARQRAQDESVRRNSCCDPAGTV